MDDKFKPKIGKTVIETLTLGMYEDARFIYREYIQNAADQIDIAVEEGILTSKSEGKIGITIDTSEKQITIEDNATGIKVSEVLNFLGDVANSQKNGSNRKGFRGIGRLGGLGYCEKLIFETSYKGEAEKSIISLDANLLRKIIQDRENNADASAVISVITSVSQLSEQSDKHYFKVSLIGVTNDFILNEEEVKNYLTLVAPLPFNPNFSFANEIIEHFKDINITLDEYHVTIGLEQLFKSYKDQLIGIDDNESTIIGVDFFHVTDGEGSLLGAGWFAIRDFVNKVLHQSVNERGIRLRKNNIQIGDAGTLNKFFNIERTNFRFVGELHALSSALIPNARRDYFNDNATCQVFEKQLKDMFGSENWENRFAQKASKIYGRIKEIEDFKAAVADYEELKPTIDMPAKQDFYRKKLIDARSKAQRASSVINNIKVSAENDRNLKKLFDHIIGEKDLALPEIDELLVKSEIDPPTFNKLNDGESNVACEIIEMLYSFLSFEDADIIKKKIIERYN